MSVDRIEVQTQIGKIAKREAQLTGIMAIGTLAFGLSFCSLTGFVNQSDREIERGYPSALTPKEFQRLDAIVKTMDQDVVRSALRGQTTIDIADEEARKSFNILAETRRAEADKNTRSLVALAGSTFTLLVSTAWFYILHLREMRLYKKIDPDNPFFRNHPEY